ncbi:hypothetical protein C8N47_104164 [Mangrovibacterium marinum]|uniref:Uncharacterized protein n=1 Tax=Mangrovibacterium marinum TaxID=1639118 RepID=A0A2T5C4B6_9BACT|nr:hypothetical protein C8N47_104164 [Mangrovibacterium marinum]
MSDGLFSETVHLANARQQDNLTMDFAKSLNNDRPTSEQSRYPSL